jgi:hypothetical protein
MPENWRAAWAKLCSWNLGLLSTSLYSLTHPYPSQEGSLPGLSFITLITSLTFITLTWREYAAMAKCGCELVPTLLSTKKSLSLYKIARSSAIYRRLPQLAYTF